MAAAGRWGPTGGELVTAVVERALQAGLSAPWVGNTTMPPDNPGNSRNSSTSKTAQTAVSP